MSTDLSTFTPEETWERARFYHGAIGSVPSLFSSCVRAIGKVEAVLYPIDTPAVRELAVAPAEFLVGTSPTLKSIFYSAARVIHPNSQASASPTNVHELLEPFSPSEIAAVIGITYLYRRCRTACPEAEWPRIRRRITVQSALGHLIGHHMEFVGAGTGMLLGAIRPLALATFAIRDENLFAQYRRRRKGAGSTDTASEIELFGCSHLHVASLIVRSLGFCMPRSPLSMSLGLDALDLKGEVLPSKLRGQLLSLRAACAAIDHTHLTGEFEAAGEDYQLVLSQSVEGELKAKIEDAIRMGGFEWLDATRAELPTSLSTPPHSAEAALND